MRRIRGLIDLVFDLVDETTLLVERAHGGSVARWTRRFAPVEPARRAANAITRLQTGIAGGVCNSIRLINGITRWSTGAVADALEREPLRTQVAHENETANARFDHVQALGNGLWGDYLSRGARRLELGMSLRHKRHPLEPKPDPIAQAYPSPTSKICVFVHGLASTESSWSLFSEGHYSEPNVTFGSRLRGDLGYTPIYIRYNTGRPIFENGRALAKLLTALTDAYPVPIERIALVGHSMGGLVVRSAAYSAYKDNEPWLVNLRHVACLGSPHHGAPIERAVRWLAPTLRRVPTVATQISADLLASRSAGIKDLGYSHTAYDEWFGDEPEELLEADRRNVAHVDGVGYHFLAATIGRQPDHPLSGFLGDLLVPLQSASGQATEPARRIPFSSGTVFAEMNHFDILNHPDVYEVLRGLLAT